jgi:hypothetical protein
LIRRLLVYFGLVCGLAAPACAQTFAAFNLKSGMTVEEVKRAMPGYEIRWYGDRGSIFLEGAGDRELYASLLFCNNVLSGIDRAIDPDTDFIRYFADRLRDFGQPQVTIRSNAWTGPGGGEIQALEFVWIRSGVKYTLSLTPEGRTGSGELRHSRNASVSFFVVGACIRK